MDDGCLHAVAARTDVGVESTAFRASWVRPAKERHATASLQRCTGGRYFMPRTPQYHRPDCSGTIAGLVSVPHTRGVRQARSSRRTPEPTEPMSTDLATRIWRVATVIGPLVAVALTLAAGRRW